MKHILAILASLAFYSGPVLADSWQEANRESAAFLDQGNFEKATMRARDAIELYARFEQYKSVSHAQLTLNLIDIYYETRNYKRARQILRDTLSTVSKKNGQDPVRIILFEEQANVSQRLGDFKQMEKDLHAMTAAGEAAFGGNDYRVADLYIKMANQLKALKGFIQAKRTLESARRIMEENYKPNHPLGILVALEMAKIELEAKHYGRAEKQYIAFLDRLKAMDIDTSKIQATALAQLVYLYDKKHDDEAIDRTMLEIAKLPISEETGARLILRLAPEFPRSAAYTGNNGEVLAEFSISKTGQVINPRVIESNGSKAFDRAVLKSLKKWRFTPKMVDGSPVVQHNYQFRVVFIMRTSVPTGSRIRK